MLDPFDFRPRAVLKDAQNEDRISLEATAIGDQRKEFLCMQHDFQRTLEPVTAQASTEQPSGAFGCLRSYTPDESNGCGGSEFANHILWLGLRHIGFDGGLPE